MTKEIKEELEIMLYNANLAQKKGNLVIANFLQATAKFIEKTKDYNLQIQICKFSNLVTILKG